MKLIRHLLPFLAIVSALFAAGSVTGAESKTKESPAEQPVTAKGKLVPAKEVDAAWLANARKNYPLNTCLSSDEKFGDPADIATFVYREPGKPDRLVLFCCEGCGDDFLKEADRCLAKLDAAAKGKGAEKNRGR
ncbi:MAG: hypothetical protein Q7S40_07100 [Opitutaceae bacterium]|nr:hypothetical protein [Opitutaceae bacterium]